jgi:hypothetical protein
MSFPGNPIPNLAIASPPVLPAFLSCRLRTCRILWHSSPIGGGNLIGGSMKNSTRFSFKSPRLRVMMPTVLDTSFRRVKDQED